MIQADLVRRYILRNLKGLRIYISCLSEREQVALERLSGPQGVETMARIVDYTMQQLGHEPTDFGENKRLNVNIRAAREFETLPLEEVPAKRAKVK